MGNINKTYRSRMHSSWVSLFPQRNINHLDANDETFEAYQQRIQIDFPNIPAAVLEQWLFLHTRNVDMINNYGWIDYHQVQFSEISWTHEQIHQIQIFSQFQPYVINRSQTDSFAGFMCADEDREYWETYGTWRVPIIVLKTETITNSPKYCELDRPFQLVEGHSRLGYYYAFKRYSQMRLFEMPENHKIFLMET